MSVSCPDCIGHGCSKPRCVVRTSLVVKSVLLRLSDSSQQMKTDNLLLFLPVLISRLSIPFYFLCLVSSFVDKAESERKREMKLAWVAPLWLRLLGLLTVSESGSSASALSIGLRITNQSAGSGADASLSPFVSLDPNFFIQVGSQEIRLPIMPL